MSPFRPDIQALRALAVLAVIAFHVWPSTVRGGYVGVDIFFVISGYLITGHLLREVASTGRVDLPAFYARRARRLLPAASLTLVAVGLAAYLWMPASTWAVAASDMAASILYAENWMLVGRAVDYHAQGQTPSPLQHFWSLAVEEQFYLGWPLLVGGVAAVWRRRCGVGPAPALTAPPPPRPAFALPMGALCGLSFAASLYYAHTNPAAGYFMTLTRLHELGAGGLLGIWASGWSRKVSKADAHQPACSGQTDRATRAGYLGRSLGAAAGLLAIGGSIFLYTPHLPFPGAAALLPVAGAAAVIAAGEGSSIATHALTSLLAHPWLLYIGDISYSLYLAHWPVVVVYPFATGRPVDGVLADGLAVLVVSWALAHASNRLWEGRFRTRSDVGDGKSTPISTAWWLAACSTGGCLMVAFSLRRTSLRASQHVRITATLPKHASDILCSSTETSSLPVFPGAEAVVQDAAHKNVTFGCHLPLSKVLPPVDVAFNDKPPAYKSSCWQGGGRDDLMLCLGDGSAAKRYTMVPLPVNGSTDSTRAIVHQVNATSSPHVVILGDSHVLHWLPVFEAVGRRHGWRVTGLSKSACLIAAGNHKGSFSVYGSSDAPCRRWVSNALAYITKQRPAAVILTAYSRYHHFNKAFKNSSDALHEAGLGVARTIAAIRNAHVPVVVIKETPVADAAVPACLASAVRRVGDGKASSECTTPAAHALLDGPLNYAAKLLGTATIPVLSFDDAFCDTASTACGPVIGNVLAFRDKHHFTATYAKTLVPALERRIIRALPGLA